MIEAINLCKPLSYTSHVNRNVCFYGSHDSFCELNFLLVMYIGTAVSVRSVLGGMIVTQLLILTVPFLITIYMKSDHKQIYSLHLPAILQNKYRMALSILISSVIFGVFHMSIVKLIPTAMFSPVEMLGMILVGIICLSMGICLFRLKRSENIIKKHSK